MSQPYRDHDHNSPSADIDQPPVQLLWTGGWDSSYRLLDVLLCQHRSVQPHYVLDPYRGSTGSELRAMANMRTAIVKRLDNGVILWPTAYVGREGIEANDEVTRAWHELRSHGPLGSQYEWIARYAEMADLHGLELSVHVDDLAHAHLSTKVRTVDDQGTSNAELDPDPKRTDANHRRVFGRLRFPLLQVSKLDMQQNAEAAGWLDILEMSWFCHHPRNGRPCGTCLPCKFTMDEGLGRRIPASRRLLGRFLWTPPGRLLWRISDRLKQIGR